MALYMGKLRTVCFDDDICQTLLHTTARTSRCSDCRSFWQDLRECLVLTLSIGVVFVDSGAGAISLLIDFECSGILEIMAYLSLLAFFQAYSRYERIAVGVIGTVYIILANAIRITVIGVIIYYKGMSAYYMAHTFVGRIVFYGLSIMLYFIVFTKAQIVRQKVGGFTYGTNK